MEKRLNLEKATRSLHAEEWRRWVLFLSQSLHYLKIPASEVRIATTMFDFDSNISDLEQLAIQRSNVTVFVANEKDGNYVYQRGASVFEVSAINLTVNAVAKPLSRVSSQYPNKFPFHVLKLSWDKQLEPRVLEVADHLIRHYGADNMLFGLSCVPSTPETMAAVGQTTFNAVKLDELCNVNLKDPPNRPPRSMESLRREVNLSKDGKGTVIKTLDILPVLRWHESREHYVTDGRRYRFVLDSEPKLYSDFLVLDRHRPILEPFSTVYSMITRYSSEDRTKEGFDRLCLEIKKILGKESTDFLKIRIPLGSYCQGLESRSANNILLQYHGSEKEISRIEKRLRALFLGILDTPNSKLQQSLSRRTVTLAGYDEVQEPYEATNLRQAYSPSPSLCPESLMTLKAYESLKPKHKKDVDWFHSVMVGYEFNQNQMEHLYEVMRKSRWYTYSQLKEGNSLRAFLNDVRHFVVLQSPENFTPRNILKYIGTEPRTPTHGRT